MQTQSAGFTVGSWFAAVAACASAACAGGYLVGMDLAVLKSTLTDKEAELVELRSQVAELNLNLRDAESAARQALDRREHAIKSLEAYVNLRDEQIELARRLVEKKDALVLGAFEFQSPLTLTQIVTAKNSFHDIQHEVAAGNFKGLDLTNAYQRLKAIFENPDLEELNIAYDEAKGIGGR
ncbi:hypothetical protein DES53_10833 [Roseimicrobium gellanilyticum]|uniref:Uncharacterized protein n=1 Tax=Roseimicrobium gellanilyticum TaxID=748857 RepID=A0A366HD73_9BACT|nr:hypothetical protein [Roseimicrobium gellanilyticum]RBP40327.1 hypothetical protein DES53_10833 [Roseimicrobium gellanilyticum]